MSVAVSETKAPDQVHEPTDLKDEAIDAVPAESASKKKKKKKNKGNAANANGKIKSILTN
jgi:hypothetical protein